MSMHTKRFRSHGFLAESMRNYSLQFYDHYLTCPSNVLNITAVQFHNGTATTGLPAILHGTLASCLTVPHCHF